MIEAPWVIMGEASDDTRDWVCRVMPILGGVCVSVDPYSPPPSELAVGVLVTVQPPIASDAPDVMYGRQAVVVEEIPTDRWPIYVVKLTTSPETWSTDNPEDLEIADRWIAMGEEPEYLLTRFTWMHCDWPRRFPGDTHGNH